MNYAKKLIDAEIHRVPWEHKVIDNFLESRDYDVIVNSLIQIKDKIVFEETQPNNGVWLHEAIALGLPEDTAQLILDINKQLLMSVSTLDNFKSKKDSKLGYFSVPRIGVFPPNFKGDIHDDAETEDKTAILVIYLYPENSYGTNLYTSDSEESFVTQIDWEKNRAFCFAPYEGLTWHGFNSKDSVRITLNFYYERIENMSYINNLSDQKIEWFYGQYTKGTVVHFLDDKLNRV